MIEFLARVFIHHRDTLSPSAAELAVGLPQGGGSQSVPIADEQSGEKFDHTMYPFPAVIRRG